MLFFFNDTATTEIYTLSLHDALPISPSVCPRVSRATPGTRDEEAGGGENGGVVAACGRVWCRDVRGGQSPEWSTCARSERAEEEMDGEAG